MLERLAEKVFGKDQLGEVQKIIGAENSDLFDVLAHVAFALAPIPRKERAQHARETINTTFSEKQQAFLNFVLDQYVKVGVEELSQDKLSPLLKLKYNNAIHDAIAELGPAVQIGQLFGSFQRYLYDAATQTRSR